MSDLESSSRNPHDSNDEESRGPDLKLFYSLIAFALVAAIAIAALIVLPFYLRR